MPDHGFARCDGHHKTVDFRLRKIGARRYQDNKESPGIRRGFEFRNDKHTLEEGEAPLGSPTLSQRVRLAMKKGLRNAAIAFSYRHYVAAYLAGRVHRAMPPNQNR